jgi:YggT family protein
MLLVKAVLDALVVLLLVRLLIRPNEAFFHPLYRLFYRITDPILLPSRSITRSPIQGILLTVLALVVLRGVLYISMGQRSFAAGVDSSLQEILQLIFQFYMVIWVIAALAGRGYGAPVVHLMARAFLPVDAALGRLGVPRSRFILGSFLLLWILFAILSAVVHATLTLQDIPSPMLLAQTLAAGLILLLGLFSFPGFFSLVILVGALLSWVSPDPSNPVVQAIYGISEPLLMPFRRILPHLGGIDISPILALLAFQFLGGLGEQLVVAALRALQ